MHLPHQYTSSNDSTSCCNRSHAAQGKRKTNFRSHTLGNLLPDLDVEASRRLDGTRARHRMVNSCQKAPLAIDLPLAASASQQVLTEFGSTRRIERAKRRIVYPFCVPLTSHRVCVRSRSRAKSRRVKRRKPALQNRKFLFFNKISRTLHSERSEESVFPQFKSRCFASLSMTFPRVAALPARCSILRTSSFFQPTSFLRYGVLISLCLPASPAAVTPRLCRSLESPRAL